MLFVIVMASYTMPLVKVTLTVKFSLLFVYSAHLAPSDFHLSRSIQYTFEATHCPSVEEVKKFVDG